MEILTRAVRHEARRQQNPTHRTDKITIEVRVQEQHGKRTLIYGSMIRYTEPINRAPTTAGLVRTAAGVDAGESSV